MKAFLLVFLGGGVGSMLRYGIGRLSLNYTSNLPLGTFLANILSCLILALILSWLVSKTESETQFINLLLITGFCGGLSTFSTFSYESFLLMKNGLYNAAILNIVISLLMGIAAFFIILKKTPF